MIFRELPLQGAYLIEIEKREDERGFFARTWCENEFKNNGIYRIPVQTNMSFTKNKGTLRGMHYQVQPKAETKLVRCTKGSVYDVIIDIRSDSKTYKDFYGIELNERNNRMLFVPEGFAHGFLTLEDNTEFVYQVSEFYSPDFERGIRYNDSNFNIKWPIDIKYVSDKDANHPNFS